MSSPLIIAPLPGVGFYRRIATRLRRVFSRRIALRLCGIEHVALEGRVCAIRPVPLGIARDMVPALLRCARSFCAWDISESLYDDFVTVLSLGLRLPRRVVEGLSVPLWELAPVIERIAKINGLPTVEAGRSDLGKILATLMSSTGMASSRGSSEAPDGHGSTSNNA